MINQECLDILKQGVGVWNEWTEEHDIFELDLSRANLSGTDLKGANLSGVSLNSADLSGSDLSGAVLVHTDLSEAKIGAARLRGTNFSEAFLNKTDLTYSDLDGACFSMAVLKEANLSMTNLTDTNFGYADLTGAQLRGAQLIAADLRGAKLNWANLSEANLSGANLRGAQLIIANLNETILYGANLTRANLGGANLVKTNLTKAILQDCRIYGISAWDVQINEAKQENLIITPPNQLDITVDNLKVAQFIYLLLNNKEIRAVFDTITSKVVLILGSFTDERKAILDALRDELRKWNYSPVLFDFEKPASRDITETVSTLAHMARFVIADITGARSIRQELQAIVPNLPSVPIQPLLQVSESKYGMFEHFARFPWVLPVYHYTDQASLLQSLEAKVIGPAEQKAQELTKR